MSDRLSLGDEVARALSAGGPVVALETTVVTHGLPHPDGLRMAAELEKQVRAAGAVPATIGVSWTAASASGFRGPSWSGWPPRPRSPS